MTVFSYEVGAIFMIEDRGTPVLERLGEAFGALDAKINQVQEKLATVGSGKGLFSGVTEGIERVSGLFDGLTERATRAGEAMEAAFRRGAEAATAAARSVNELTEAINRAAGASERMGGGAAASGGAAFNEERPPSGGRSSIALPFAGGVAAGGLIAGPPGGGGGGAGGGGGIGGGGLPAPFFGYPIGTGPGGGGILGGGGAGGGGGGAGGGGFGPGALGGAAATPMPPLAVGRSPASAPPGGAAIGLWEIGEALAGVREYRLALQQDLALRQSLEALNIRPEDPEFVKNIATMTVSAREATDRSIISEPEGAKMLGHFAGIMIGSGEVGMKQVGQLFPIAARLAELSHQRTGAQLGAEAVAGGEFGHLTGNYDPTKMGPLLDLINAISQRTNTTVAHQFEIQRYGMPMALGAGLTPEQAAIDVAFSELNMGPNTRAGTAYGQFLTASLTGAQPKTLQQHVQRNRARREFEQAMRLEDPEGLQQHIRTMKDPKQLQAMEDLGLVDKVTKKHLNLDAAGNLNEEFEKKKIREFALHHTAQEIESTLKDAFGQIGFRYAQLFTKADALEREQMLRGQPFKEGDKERLGVLGAPTVLEQQADLMQAPLQKFQYLIAQTDTILSTLAGSTLPAFAAGLDVLNAGLTGAKDFLRVHPTEQAPIASLLGSFLASGLGGSMNWLSRNASGFKGVAGRGLGSLLSTAGGIGTMLSTGWLINDLVNTGRENLQDAIFGEGFSARADEDLAKGNPFNGHLGPLGMLFGGKKPGPRPENLPGANDHSGWPMGLQPPPSPPPPPANVTVHLGPVTMQGVPDDSSLHMLLKKLTDGLHDALATMTGDAHGSSQSAFTFPGPL